MLNYLSSNLKCLLIICTLLFTSALVSGCQAKPLPYISPSEAHLKLKQVLEDDYKISPTITQVDQTVWVYLPVKDGLYNLKGNEPGARVERKSSTKQEIKLLEGGFDGRILKIEYDIGRVRNYAKAQTYNYAPSEEFSRIQRAIFEEIRRAYPPKDQNEKGNLLAIKEDYPEFFVLVFADITNGLDYSITLNLNDYHRSKHDPGFSQDYQQRLVQKPLGGNSEIIGDMTGEYLKYKDVTWPEFLGEQILQRIRFKFGTSAFPPDDNPELEFLKQTTLTTSAYNFEEFDTIELKDLNTNKTSTTTRETLFKTYPLYKDPPKGKIHTLKFDLKGNISEETTTEETL